MSLIGEERKKIILERIQAEGKINTIKLAKEMNVSSETIRKYFDELETENKLKKVYGGAVKVSLYNEELPYTLIAAANQEKKQIVANYAVQFIEDNDIIILDEGNTLFKLAELCIDRKNLTVLTSSLPILFFLSSMQVKERFDGKIIFIGGLVDSKHNRITGSDAEQFLEPYYVKKAFLAVEGIDAQGGITSHDREKSFLTRKFIKHSQYSYILADSTKINKRSFYKICDIKDVTGIFCDQPPDGKMLSFVKKNNVEWVSSGDMTFIEKETV